MAKDGGIVNDAYIDSEDLKISETEIPKDTNEAMFEKTQIVFENTCENSVKTSNIGNEDAITQEDVAVIEKETITDENDLKQIEVVFVTTRSNLSMGSDANQLIEDLKRPDAQNENVIRNEEGLGDGDENEDSICYKFKGPAFRSFNERRLKKSWRRRSLEEELKFFCKLKESTPELNRSQYSLVSCGELTPGAVQLWLGLPEEVKYDPALASFRQLYEKECAKERDSSKKKSLPKSRLPLVNSAPHLNNNIHHDEVALVNGKENVDVQALEETPIPEDGHVQKKESKWARAGQLIKMFLLLCTWLFFTVVFLMYSEKEEIVRNSSVPPNEVKEYLLHKADTQLSVLLTLAGPFLSENSEAKLNSSSNRQLFQVWLKMSNVDGNLTRYQKEIKPWTIILEENNLDFSVGEKRTKTLRIEGNTNSDIRILFKTNTNVTVPFTMTYIINPLDMKTGVIYASLILCGLYVLIIFEIINRTMAAVLMSTVSVAVLSLCGSRPSLPTLLAWLDAETLLLLFSMMILVAIMAETGMFDFLAVFTFEVTKGKLWPLITVLCAITAVLSTFLDNVTTVLLMTPVTIRLCEVMDLDPIPILMSMVLFSNIGGTATPVGDPPNVIIASNKAVIQAGVNFTNFTLHMTVGILFVCVQTYFQLRFMFRDTRKMRICVPRDIQDLRQQITVWRRASDSLPHLSKDQLVVRERLDRKVKKLQSKLEILEKESDKRACPKDTFDNTLKELKEKYKIRDKILLIKSSIAIGFVVLVFFLHAIPEFNRVSLGWTALLGAILLLLLWDRAELEPALHKVEWGTLLFFAALFVLMEALSKLGLIEFIGGLTESLILQVSEGARLTVAILLILWVSGVSSAFVDNIPLTTMMVRVVTSLGSNPTLNLPMMPLIWALSFGACLGGNGTLIGASANVVCAGVAEQHGYKFTFIQFFKIGFPIMIGHLIVASFYLLLCHCVFTWH